MAKKFKSTKKKNRPSIERDTDFKGIVLNNPKHELMGYTVFFYGAPKIGKTTAALSWPAPIVLSCETRGMAAFKAEHIKCHSWEHLEKAAEILEKKESRNKYETVIIDTVDLMYKYCLSNCCEKYGFDHPSDQGWGKGWERITDEFLAMILRIFDMGYTIIFISHSKSTEVKADWTEYTRIDPTLPNVGRKVLLPLVDIIFYMTAKETQDGISERRLTTKATQEYEAGDRTRFLTDLTVKISTKNKDSVFNVLNKLFKGNVAKAK